MKKSCSWAIVCWMCLVGMSAAALAAEGEMVVYQQTFEGIAKGTDAAKIGFKVDATPQQSVWQVADGYLRGLLHNKRYDGGGISIKVEDLSKP